MPKSLRRAKLFSGASTEFGGEPNTHVSLVDAAMPGMLPVINEECVAQAVRTGLGLKAQDQPALDLRPQELFLPRSAAGLSDLAVQEPDRRRGRIQVDLTPDHSIKVGIERLHLEQDAGKSLHDQSPTMSFVDLNRSGVALMEIVSRPDMRSAEEAKAYVSKLRTILRYIGSCDGDMEKGNLRADVNVSVRRPGAPLGTRCEIKNVNSIRFIGQAIEVEARRQIAIIEDGGAIEQETRLFDPGARRDALDALEGRGARLPLFPRSRPAAARVRPGLRRRARPATARTAGRQEGALHRRLRALAPMTPACSSRSARPPTSSRPRSRTAASGATRRRSPTGSWAICRASRTRRACRVAQAGIVAGAVATLVDLIGEKVISGKIAKDVLQCCSAPTGRRPREIVKARGLLQVTDAGAIEKAVDEVIAANPDKAEQAKAKPDCSVGSLVR